MSKAWQIELEFPGQKGKIKTFVYSDNGKDIENRFKQETCKVTVLGEIDDPVADTKAVPKKEDKYI